MAAADSNPAATPRRRRIGIVGAGRSRQGLGPYLASAFERAGCDVVGVAGRDLASAQRSAAALAVQLGHAVAAHQDARALATAVDALVVAAPVAAHEVGLAAALAAGIPCLCEKPLVGWRQAAVGQQLVAQFAARGLLLAENCQWPFVLPVLFALHPQLRGERVRKVAMGLSPAGPGRAMVEDSLSHVLSVVQGLAALSRATTVGSVTQSDAGPAAEHNLVHFQLVDGGDVIDVELHLRRCPEPPRPAWLAVNDRRIDRRLGPDYTQSFVADQGRSMIAEDPLQQLVYGFAANLPSISRERIDSFAEAISVRLGLYAHLLSALQG